jgi:glycosyltransferase involved in cell wall biosynthesis
MPPLLSICIPTLNRAELLNDQLISLEQQVGPFLDRLEIVVADNASKDHTAEVVATSPLPLVYGRQQETVGFTKNVLFATTHLASGEYVWLIGDDDLVLPGALERIFLSLQDAPDVDYHYLNFGWINCDYRHQVIHDHQSMPDVEFFERLQFDSRDWQRLKTMEDIVNLDSDNVSAAFSGIFCFVTRRQLFIDGREILKPSDSLDGSSTNISDCFPHAMITLPALAGKPIAYVGEPCLMQGVTGWEWGAYAYKNMIFGTHQLFDWLEQSAISEAAMQVLWESYYEMAGRLFFRMQYSPEEHKGIEIVLDKAIPDCSKHQTFWDSFMREAQMFYHTENEAIKLAKLTQARLALNPALKVGLWGIFGRGQRLVKDNPDISQHLVWVTDRDINLHGLKLDGSSLTISAPDTLKDISLDILIIATRQEFIKDVIAFATPYMASESLFISIDGYEWIP